MTKDIDSIRLMSDRWIRMDRWIGVKVIGMSCSQDVPEDCNSQQPGHVASVVN